MGHFRKDLTDRQASVLAHYVGVLGFDTQKMHYFKSEEFLEDGIPHIKMVWEEGEVHGAADKDK